MEISQVEKHGGLKKKQLEEQADHRNIAKLPHSIGPFKATDQ